MAEHGRLILPAATRFFMWCWRHGPSTIEINRDMFPIELFVLSPISAVERMRCPVDGVNLVSEMDGRDALQAEIPCPCCFICPRRL